MTIAYTILLAIMMPGVAFSASKEIISAQADVFVADDDDPNLNKNNFNILQVGVGRGNKVCRMVSYIRFDMTNVPKATLLKKTQVTRATVSLFAQSFGLAKIDSRFFVSITPCSDSDWAEDRMSWNNRVCPNPVQTEDIAVIDGNSLPQLYQWDVTQSVTEFVRGGVSLLTFIISAFSLKKMTGGEREIISGEKFGPEESVGFVRFWSRERAAFGRTAVPTLVIVYEQEDTELARFVKTSFSIIYAIGIFLGIWEALRHFKKA